MDCSGNIITDNNHKSQLSTRIKEGGDYTYGGLPFTWNGNCPEWLFNNYTTNTSTIYHHQQISREVPCTAFKNIASGIDVSHGCNLTSTEIESQFSNCDATCDNGAIPCSTFTEAVCKDASTSIPQLRGEVGQHEGDIHKYYTKPIRNY